MLFRSRTGATILISSHNLTHTVDISNRIALLEKGVVIKDMTNNSVAQRLNLKSISCTRRTRNNDTEISFTTI